MTRKNVLLIITGSVAANKTPQLIKLLQEASCQVTCILTVAGEKFISSTDLLKLTKNVRTDLFPEETLHINKMDHISLSRECDVIAVVPATANTLFKMAHGCADDLSSTTLLASNKRILVAPAMNVEMWEKPSTQRNVSQLKKDDILFIGPAEGNLACGEYGRGRMAPVEAISDAIVLLLKAPLADRTVLVTSGPTYEPIDPVRFIGNRSSGKQGHAIAAAFSIAGANVTLVTGPVHLRDPAGVKTVHCNTALEMLAACTEAMPTDIAVCVAAVSDWRNEAYSNSKLKKCDFANNTPMEFHMKENPDILRTLAGMKEKRPLLVVGFSAETESLLINSRRKLSEKKCDWILANNVCESAETVFGAEKNHVYFLSENVEEDWGVLLKKEVATRLVETVVEHFRRSN